MGTNILEPSNVNEADTEREKQRSESEARDIIHDIQKLYTLPEERKTRWIWELLQNAKDVANTNGVNIHIKLTRDRLDFKHNGAPFETKHLLAILYKTSTKSLNGEGGTTGKYGTGFVTTHILNKKLKVSGVHKKADNSNSRRFLLEIDRTSADMDESIALPAMQQALKVSFRSISGITEQPAENITDHWNTFSYDLNTSFLYAEKGLIELEHNLLFTLLINEARIKNVIVELPTGSRSYTIIKEETMIADIQFISFDKEQGLLYRETGDLIFGIPALKIGNNYRLLPTDNQAVLYKEFPLIGTEGFNLPVFIQHKKFHPTEQRDAIRTKITTEDEPDPVAAKNRKALIEFVENYIPFVEKLISAETQGTYLFAQSGLPLLVDTFSNRSWYEEHIQKPIREMILTKAIVQTCAGKLKIIAGSKFITGSEETHKGFFELASELIPEQIPEKNSIWHWAIIISQAPELWPENITLDIEALVKLVPDKIDLNDDKSFGWLKKLYEYLELNNLTHLGRQSPIYPSEAGSFYTEDQVRIHPAIDEEFKIVASGLGRHLDDEFLNRKIGQLSTIKEFDLSAFYKELNNELIANLKIEAASEEQVKAIFHVCCLFKSDRAYRREKWFSIINQILPAFAQEKRTISTDYENYGRSAELWTIKYICGLIEKIAKPSLFAVEYFQGNIQVCFDWLNDFLEFIFGLQDESKEVILKRRIIPIQTDVFRAYDDNVFAENEPKYFNDTIKDIYRDHAKKIDPRSFIVDIRIKVESIRRKNVEELTNEIDKIFRDENIEIKVKKGGVLNEMFLQLNDWFEQFSTSTTLLSTFSSKRASLYVLALGEGFSKQIMEIQKAGRSMDDLTELAKLKLTPDEMKRFESAAAELGTDKLFEKVKEMLDAKLQIDRWKTIGTAAENAFTEALSSIHPAFEILNPDIGKDFVIKANGKEYAIEIKSVDALKANVNMSLLQGETAVLEKDAYALCVLSRPFDNSPVDKDYFIKESRFVTDIGYKIGGSIESWRNGIRELDTNGEIKVVFENREESLYVSRNVWKERITFEDFVSFLKTFMQA